MRLLRGEIAGLVEQSPPEPQLRDALRKAVLESPVGGPAKTLGRRCGARASRRGVAARRQGRNFVGYRALVLRVVTARLRRRVGGSMPEGMRSSDTAKAAGLAAAALGANVLALAFTVIFARLLGASDYGSLAALLSTYLILSVPGSAMQVAVGRETALGRLGRDGALAATVAHWLGRLLLVTVGDRRARGAGP